MVTLNDLSAIERKNHELSSTLAKLRRSQESIVLKNRELEALASQDPLTGLKNRRAIGEVLTVQMRSAADRGSPLCCIMTDIDHFKRINDTFGHAVATRSSARSEHARRREQDERCGRAHRW